MLKSQKLWEALIKLKDAYNRDVIGKSVCVSPEGNITYLTKGYKSITIRAIVPNEAVSDEHGMKSVLDYLKEEYYQANEEGLPGKVRISRCNDEVSEVLIVPFDIEVEYLPDFKAV